MVQIGKMNRLSIKGIQAYALQEGEEVDLLVYVKTDFRLTPGQACSSYATALVDPQLGHSPLSFRGYPFLRRRQRPYRSSTCLVGVVSTWL